MPATAVTSARTRGGRLGPVRRQPVGGRADTVWVTEVWADEAASDRALSGDLGEAGIGEVIGAGGLPELVDLTPLGGPGLPA